MGQDESGTLASLKGHRRDLIDPKIEEYGGRIVKTTGDGLLLEFPSVVEAVRCAVDVQRGMAERNAGLPPERRIEFRVGINIGDVILGVNVAARLQGLAEPGGIGVSRVVRRASATPRPGLAHSGQKPVHRQDENTDSFLRCLREADAPNANLMPRAGCGG